MTDDREGSGRGGSGCATAAAVLSVMVWALLFLRAAGHYAEVATYHYPGFTGAWDVWVWLPLGMALGMLACILFCTFALRSAGALVAFSAVALIGVFPYLVMTGGGV